MDSTPGDPPTSVLDGDVCTVVIFSPDWSDCHVIQTIIDNRNWFALFGGTFGMFGQIQGFNKQTIMNCLFAGVLSRSIEPTLPMDHLRLPL